MSKVLTLVASIAQKMAEQMMKPSKHHLLRGWEEATPPSA